MFPLAKPSQDREDLFIGRYAALRNWALKLTDQEPNEAEDLLHDAFIHFCLSRTSLDRIENLDAYLYTMLRNLRLSQVRHLARTPQGHLSLIDFDSAELGLSSVDPRDRIKAQDELRAICQYALARKDSSKAASVLILRFFHAYYPNEIAQILKSPRSAVDNLLQTARKEARVFRSDPASLVFLRGEQPAVPRLSFGQVATDIFAEVRGAIFQKPAKDCPKTSIDEIYGSEGTDDSPVPAVFLSHLVTCMICLDRVNDALGLMDLNTRLGTGPKKGGPKTPLTGGGGRQGGGMGPSPTENFLRRGRESIKQVFEHQPEELLISVNGFIVGSQRINSEVSQLAISVNLDETIGFVEVYSERGVCLLFESVEPPPAGRVYQPARVELSGDRVLELGMDFAGNWPQLTASYRDPSFAASHSALEFPTAEPSTSPVAAMREASTTAISRTLDVFRSMLQPARLTTSFAVLLIAVLLILKFAPFGSPSASELIARSIAADNARIADQTRVLHRTFNFEETSADGQVISRKKIDVWQSGERGIAARRLYDDKGQLTAGDWRDANGVQTIYGRGVPAKLQPAKDLSASSVNFVNAWQTSVNAKEFSNLVGANLANVDTLPNQYVIRYASSASDSDKPGITFATITLSREDLHATDETFGLRTGDETRTYHITETGYDWKPSNTVAPAVFDPNVELTGRASSGKTSGANAITADNPGFLNPSETTTNSSVPSAAIATPSLEVEVIDALNNAGAFTGEQIDVSRSPDGRIDVTALVETSERKHILLAALNNVRNNPAVRIKIDTIAEAQAHIKPGKHTNVTPGEVDQVEVNVQESTVFNELKKKLSDDAARRFADSVLSRSRSARSHALAMRQLSQRFSQADLQSLTLDERNKWLAAIRGHAEAFVRDAEGLRRDLAQFFPEATAEGPGGGLIRSDSEFQSRIRDLYESSLGIDRVLGSSFALTAGESNTSVLKSSAFWRQYASAVASARTLAAAR